MDVSSTGTSKIGKGDFVVKFFLETGSRARTVVVYLLAGIVASGVFTSCSKTPAPGEESAGNMEEARVIAKEAYVYGNPMVDNYRLLHAYFVDRKHPEYKGTWNQITNIARVYTPEDKAVQTPNSDTPYSFVGLDLRTEPMVLTVPLLAENRYFSIQLIDLYTHVFDYIGSRTTGNAGGSFLIAGPDWKGEAPERVTKVIRSETELAMAFYRTQLFDPDDIENVRKIQSGYEVQPLSAFLGRPAPDPAAAIEFIEPLTQEEIRSSLDVFTQLNFLLQFCPTHPSEEGLMARFADIGSGAGEIFDASKLSPESQAAVRQGISDAWADFMEEKAKGDAGVGATSADIFGSREHLKNNYLYRMAGAVVGIWGNSEQEAIYPSYFLDAEGELLDGSHRYTVRFVSSELPPVNAFWSLTMYELPASLLVANPLDRYLINSPMLPQLERDSDGGVTLYIQNESPGGAKVANWLPSPEGPFVAIMRLYWPKQEALDGTWQLPPMHRAD